MLTSSLQYQLSKICYIAIHFKPIIKKKKIILLFVIYLLRKDSVQVLAF